MDYIDYTVKTHASLFTGICGFDKAAEHAGYENVFHCEINERLRSLSKYFYPNAHSYENITESDFTFFKNRIDVLSGGFPCQPYSNAGLQLGTDDERHLWPQNIRAVREIQPTWVFGENVPGIISWNGGLVFEQVQADLEAEGYEVQTYVLPAAGVNAPHTRSRVWFMAYSHRNRINRIATISKFKEENEAIRPDLFEQTLLPGIQRPPAHANGERCSKPQFKPESIKTGFNNRAYDENWRNWTTQSPVCIGNDGIPTESLRAFIRNNSDGVLTEKEIDQIVSKTIRAYREEAIRGGGNAIVPQVAMQLFSAINQFEIITPI